jgi:signal transduction histidine kinase
VPPGARGSLIKEKVSKPDIKGQSRWPASSTFTTFVDRDAQLPKKLDRVLKNQRKKVIHRLFGREHQVFFDALFLGLQTLKMRVFVHDIEGSKKVIAHLKSLLKKYIAKIRDYIKTQHENLDSNSIFADHPQVRRMFDESGAEETGLRNYIVQLMKEESRATVSELHDNVLQNLASILIGLQVCEKLFEKKEEKAIKEINQLELLVWESGKNISKFCAKEMPFNSPDIRLMHVLKQYVRGFKSIVGTDICLACSGEESRLSGDEKINLFYVAREAVTNAIRHADARTVKVELEIRKEKAVLKVADDGIGFSAREALYGAKRLGHHGLVGMEERVKLSMGKLQIDARPGEGSRLVVQIPIGGKGLR